VTDPLDPIESTITHFSQMYLDGIPHLIRDETAILSFVVTLCATEALAGYRYANTLGNNAGARFNAFVRAYFPPEYAPFAGGRLWKFRCRLVHGFSPGVLPWSTTTETCISPPSAGQTTRFSTPKIFTTLCVARRTSFLLKCEPTRVSADSLTRDSTTRSTAGTLA